MACPGRRPRWGGSPGAKRLVGCLAGATGSDGADVRRLNLSFPKAGCPRERVNASSDARRDRRLHPWPVGAAGAPRGSRCRARAASRCSPLPRAKPCRCRGSPVRRRRRGRSSRSCCRPRAPPGGPSVPAQPPHPARFPLRSACRPAPSESRSVGSRYAHHEPLQKEYRFVTGGRLSD